MCPFAVVAKPGILANFDFASRSFQSGEPISYSQYFTPGKPQGWEETGSVSRDIPGVGISGWTSNGGFHTYEMEADALGPVGHGGFVVDAQAMSALLYDFASRPAYRAAVKQEFEGLKLLYAEYQAALNKAYAVPVVKDPE